MRLHIDEDVFASTLPVGWLLSSVLWMLGVPVALLALSIAPSARPSLGRFGARPAPETAAQPHIELAPEPLFLVTVNLFNQLSLSSEQRAAELNFARDAAAAVASLYNGTVEDLPGTGLLLRFEATDNDDRSFHVICAAFALSRMLQQAQSSGRYRLGAHRLLGNPAAPLEPELEALRDAALLSALAPDNTLVISAALHDNTLYPERIDSEPLKHPLLDEMTTIDGAAYLARDLRDPHQQVIAEQVRELSYPDRSTASESTF